MTTTPKTNQTSDWAFPVYPLTTTGPSTQDTSVESDADSGLFYGGIPSPDNATCEPSPKMPQEQPDFCKRPSQPVVSQPVVSRPVVSRPVVSRPVVSRLGVVTPRPVPQLPRTTVWGTQFARATMDDAIELVDRIVQNRTPQFMITANLNYLMLSEENPDLRAVNQRCHCILADGNPIVWRSQFEPNPLPCRVAGSDMIVELARLSAARGHRIFFLGGAPGVAEAASAKLRQQFPEMQIAGTYSPPFRQLTLAEEQQMLQHIRDAQTDILLVAFGQPKGELWIYENLEQLAVPLSIQLGASFDFLAGTAKRAPAWWQKLGCEWLYRAFSDPQRLIPRYGKNLLFLLGLLANDAEKVAGAFWKKTLLPRLQKLLRRK